MTPLLLALPLAVSQSPATTDAEWIAFDFFRNGYVCFDVSVSGRPTTAFLDSGAGMTCLDSKFAAALGSKAAFRRTRRASAARCRLKSSPASTSRSAVTTSKASRS